MSTSPTGSDDDDGTQFSQRQQQQPAKNQTNDPKFLLNQAKEALALCRRETRKADKGSLNPTTIDRHLRIMSKLELQAREIASKLIKLIRPDGGRCSGKRPTDAGRESSSNQYEYMAERFAEYASVVPDQRLRAALSSGASWGKEVGALTRKMQNDVTKDVIEPLTKFANKEYVEIINQAAKIKEKRHKLDEVAIKVRNSSIMIFPSKSRSCLITTILFASLLL